jgi:hypothetical protein
MRAKGKIASQEMLQLTELGIPAWEILAKKMNKSTDVVMEMVQKRQISAAKGIEMLVEGMGERFPDMMKKQSKTLIGVWSTFKDEMSFILMDIGTAIVKHLNLKKSILNMAAWFKENKEVIVKTISAVVAGIRDFLRALAPIARALGNWIAANPRLAGTLVALLAALGPVIWMIGKFVQLAGAFHYVFAVIIPFAKGVLIGLGITIWPVVAAIAAIGVVVAVVATYWEHFAKVLAPLIKAFKELWGTLKLLFYELYRVLKPLLLPIIKMVAGAIGVTLLVALSGLATVLVLIINIITGVIKIFIGLGRVIWGVGQILWGFITGNRKMMAQGVKDMKRGASEIGDGFKTIVVDSAKAIADITKATIEGVGSMLGRGNAKAAEAAEKGGKAVGDKHTKGKKDGLKKGEHAIEDNVDKDGKAAIEKAKKHGEDAGAAYTEGMEGGLLGQGALGLTPKTDAQKADDEELKAHLHRRKAFWKAFIEGDMEGANKQLRAAEEHQRKADRLMDRGHSNRLRKQKDHQRKSKGLTQLFQGWVNRTLRKNLNKQSGMFLLSRRRRLALQRGFQEREKFAERSHNNTLAAIFRFGKNQVAALDRFFGNQKRNRRIVRNTQERGATRWHWSRILFIVGLALFGPAGLLNLHLVFGQRILAWLRQSFSRQRGTTRTHWTLTRVLTRVGATRVFNLLKRMIRAFGRWLIRVPRMFYNRIMQGANWMYRAGRGLVRRMIKGVKNTFNELTKQGKKAGQKTRKGVRKGGKGAKKDGKKVGKDVRKGFKKGTKGAKKDGEKAGKNVGKGFKKGARKGQKKAGRRTAKDFIEALKKRLGIKSPSTEARKLGVAVSNGFQEGVGWEELAETAGNKMQKVVKRMKNKIEDFGGWLKGVPKHWKNLLLLNSHYMTEAGRELAAALLHAVEQRLGIKSPSKQFERIGRFMIMGLIRGLKHEDLIKWMADHYGGVENFMRHIFNLFDANITGGRSMEWMNKFFGIDVQKLYTKLQQMYGMTGLDLGEFGTPEQNEAIMRKIFAWIKSQVPGENAEITSLYRPNSTVPSGRPSLHASAKALDMVGDMWAIAKIAAKTVMGPEGWTQGLLSNEWGEVLWQVADHYDHVHLGIKKISPFLRGLNVGGGGDIWTQMRNFFASKGGLWDDADQLAALKELIGRESSFDPNAENESSKAWGLFQFMPFHHGTPVLPQGKDSTLAEQFDAGFRYIRDKYGSPKNALDYHDDHNSYGGGGLVARVHEGERVLTARQNRWFTGLAKPLAALSTTGAASKLELKVAMPAGTTFKITNLKEGIVEVVDEGVYKHVEKTIGIEEWVDK